MNRLMLAIALLLGIGECLADGKFFSPGPIPPDLPFQRAIVVFDGEREILVVQSKYEASSEQGLRALGWVVPVPAVPEVGTMDSPAAEFTFNLLDWATRPEIYSLFKYYIWPLLILLVIRMVLRAWAERSGTLSRGRRWLLGSYAGNIALILLLFVLASNSYDGPRSGEQMKVAAALAPVQVVMETTIGVYDVKVVKADAGGELVAWLNQHGFRFDAADEKVFADYIAKKWAFVTAKITPKAVGEKSALSRSGMANPLVLRFPSKQAVYPLALTATTGRETEIELYVLHTHKMDAGGRLPLTFANKWDADGKVARLSRENGRPANVEWLKYWVEPERLLARERLAEGYISKFRGRLNSEQMKTDLVLSRATDDEPYGAIKNVLWESDYVHYANSGAPGGYRSYLFLNHPLVAAAAKGDLVRIEQLLADGADIKRHGSLALREAIESSYENQGAAAALLYRYGARCAAKDRLQWYGREERCTAVGAEIAENCCVRTTKER